MRLCSAGALLGGLLLAGIFLAYQVVSSNAQGRVWDEVESVPVHEIGLLLGTTPRLADGRANLYFEHRVQATLELFEAGKVQRVLVTGDHSRRGYNEPEEFRVRLVKGGIPNDKIHLDFAGFRTLDSVVRAKKVFGLSKVLMISQRFHNERAIYLADHFGVTAQGYNALDADGRAMLKNLVRESLARVKLFLDLVWGVQPRFLGNKIELGASQSR